MNLEEFKDKIFKEVFKSNSNQEKIEKLIASYFGHLPIPTLQLTYSFLGRCRYNKPGEVFSHVDQLSYNPKKENIYLQRCNYEGQQVFYGALPTNSGNASLLSTAVVEICLEYIKDEDINLHYMTLSRWHITRPLEVFILPYSKQSQDRNIDFKNAKENFDTIIENFASQNKVQNSLYIDSLEFISDIFCKKEDKVKYYKISSAYYNFIMNAAAKKNKLIDGLIYPSANTEAAGMNIVLNKELIDDKIIFCDHAVMYKGQRYPNDKKRFSMPKASNEVEISDDGKFCFSSIW